MRILKTIAVIVFLALAGLFVYAFFPQIKPYIPFVEKKVEEIRNSASELIPEAKISAPLEQSEFEKTASYGVLDCKNYESNVFVSEMIKEINNDRVKDGKKELKWNEKLCQSAELKAEDMDAHNYFEHVSPSGVSPWFWVKQAGYTYTFVGENLALNYFTPQSAHTALMNSPGHRANILNENFTEIGIDYVRGKLNGEDAFFVVQHFGSPAPEKPKITYVCEIDKAEKNLKELKQTKNKIEKYLNDAEDIKKELEAAGQSTKEVDDYINDLESKEKDVDGYIKEIQDYLKKCNE